MIGFFGSAPLAWPYLSSQAENGDFARGVGVFFAVIAGGAILSGAFGLLLGSGIGWAWEHAHRYRRRRWPTSDRVPTPAAASASPWTPMPRRQPGELAGRALESITYRLDSIELGFGSIRRRAPLPSVTVARGDQVHDLSEREARDMLQTLLGHNVRRVADAGDGTIELEFRDGVAIRGI